MENKFWRFVLVFPVVLFLAVMYFSSGASEDIPLIVTESEDWGHTELPLAIAPNSRFIATAHQTEFDDFDIKLYDRDEQETWTYNIAKPKSQPLPSFLLFSPDGSQLIAGGSTDGSRGGSIQVWNFALKQLLRTLAPHQVYGPAVLFSDGNTLAYGGKDGGINLININTGQPIRSITSPKKYRVSSLSLSADGKLIAAAYYLEGKRGGVMICDISTGKILWSQGLQTGDRSPDIYINAVALSPDGTTLAVSGLTRLASNTTHQIELFDVQSGKELQIIRKPKRRGQYTSSIQFSPDGRFIAAGGSEIYVWNVGNGSQRTVLEGTGKVQFSADGNLLMSRSEDIPEQFQDWSTPGTTPSIRRSISLWKRF